MKMFDNVILTDADGVLVYWEHTFINWMYFNGYGKPDSSKYELHEKYGITENESRLLSKMFNESTMLSKLPPMRDAIKYVKKLHEEHGFVFHCISAVPDLDSTRKARWENLENLFGKTAFERVVLCEYSHKKDEFTIYKVVYLEWDALGNWTKRIEYNESDLTGSVVSRQIKYRK
jgi:hypothetical protein